MSRVRRYSTITLLIKGYRETAIVREEGETPNDRNDRGNLSIFLSCYLFPERLLLGIRKATAWYNSHLNLNRPPIRGQEPPKVPTIVLMTEDVANRQNAEKTGITSTSGRSPSFFSLQGP